MWMNLENRLKANPELKRQFGELDVYINEKASQQGSLINGMHCAQNIVGYLPDDGLTMYRQG
jgi:NADH:ubiquinone oxidoreductase subunit E